MGTVESGDGTEDNPVKSLGGYSPEPYKRYVYADYENNPAHIEQLYRSRQHEAREAKKWSDRALKAEEQNIS
jgi:hypothetical protein